MDGWSCEHCEWKKSSSLIETHNTWYRHIQMIVSGGSHFSPPPQARVKEKGENSSRELWIVTPTILGMLVGGKAKVS